MDVWRKVHKLLKARPVVAGRIGGAVPLYAERYLLHGVDRVVPGVEMLALITQVGGARVHEGEVGRWRAVTLRVGGPATALIEPASLAELGALLRGLRREGLP